MSTVYTCGRMHIRKARKSRLHTESTSTINAVISAVAKVMRHELSESACERWNSQLNAELGSGTFGGPVEEDSSGDGDDVPKAWAPAKPKLSSAILDQLACATENPEVGSPRVSVGSTGAISKILARRAVERLREEKGPEWLRASGELSPAQLDDHVKLTQVLSRVAFELIVYVHARAVEMRKDDVGRVLLELHSSDQTLVGKGMRGCGVVLCESGRVYFGRAIAQVREELASALTGSVA
jgi:hypothetical protein